MHEDRSDRRGMEEANLALSARRQIAKTKLVQHASCLMRRGPLFKLAKHSVPRRGLPLAAVIVTFPGLVPIG